MKTKLIALAIAAGVAAGAAGIASSASAATPVVPAGASIHIDLGGIFGVRFGHRHGYRHRRFCRKMFVLGFRYGNPRARYLWRRHCRGYYY